MNPVTRPVTHLMVKTFSLSAALSVVSSLILISPTDSRTIQFRFKRWIDVQSVSGNVTLINRNGRESARVGQRLQSVGDGIATGAQSSATLNLDSGIGTLQVSENSQFTIQEIQNNDGGAQTKLNVSQGQVRLKLRTFTNPSSRLEIFTPAGVTGVRGTDFGVSILPSGKTGVATLRGKVAAAAQGKTVEIDRGFQSSITPGSAPLPPVPLRNNPSLDIQVFSKEDNGQVHIVAQTDDINLISIGEKVIEPNTQGIVNFRLSIGGDRSVQLLVTTPLGKQQNYQILVP